MIKNWLFFIVSGILLVFALYFLADRLMFVWRAEEAIGQVKNITAKNARCSKKRGRRGRSRVYYDCTHFHAEIGFTTKAGQPVTFRAGAGTRRGHDVPKSEASHHVGQNLGVLYDPKNPSVAYRDTFMDVWGVPFVLFVFQILSLLGSLVPGKGRTHIRIR